MMSNDKALYAINFIELLKHTKGKFHGQSFKLLPWQHEIISDVYGTLDNNGLRQYQYVYLEVPKKNGKSELVAATALYHTFADGEIKGEVYGCAADRAQASLAFDVAVDMVDQNTYLKKRCKYTASKKQLKDTLTGTTYQVLSAEAYTKHGLNASAVIFDELHAQPNRDLWDVMTFGAGDARSQPIWWVITTAGDDPDRTSIGWEIHDKAQKIADGELADPRWYAKIYGLPEGEDIWNEDNWYKANPSLGYTIDIEKVRQAAIGARNNESEERLFRWLRLNQWVANKTTSWLPLTLWDSRKSKFSAADLVGKRCYCGLDLSSTSDLTAIGFVFPPQEGLDKYVVMSEQWIPQDNMKERINKDKVHYDRWAKEGFIHVTPGDVIDYDYIKARIEAINRQYEVVAWGNDPWGAEKLRQDLDRDCDIELIKVSQNIQTMSPNMKEIERLLKLGDMEHVHNPVTRWAFGNMSVVADGNDNYKPKKVSKVMRIDPIVAIINAMYLCIKLEQDENKVREVIFA